MRFQGKLWGLAGSIALATAIPAAASLAQHGIEEGVKAWEAGRHEEAVRLWRVLADRGNGDAQFALGHAYRLGRGVPQNLNLAEQWYERAARNGHQEAQAMYGVILFQNGRRREALPFIERGAENGDPRAQYVLGTVLFNGDYLPADHPRAYALMSRAAAEGLPQAESHLRQMDQHMSAEDRARGALMARQMLNRTAPRMAESADLPPVPGSRVAATSVPASRPAGSATGQANTSRPGQPSASAPAVRVGGQPVAVQPAPRARPDHQSAPTTPSRTEQPAVRRSAAAQPAQPRQAPAAPARTGGRWRVQLGAFSTEANARRAWTQLSGGLPGLQPHYVQAGAITRLQAGPLTDRAAAERSCASVRSRGGACIVVAP
jgi:uncharacterized protein